MVSIDVALKSDWTPEGRVFWGQCMLDEANATINKLESSREKSVVRASEDETLWFYANIQRTTSLLDFSAKLLVELYPQIGPKGNTRVYFTNIDVASIDNPGDLVTAWNTIKDLKISEEHQHVHKLLDFWNAIKHNGMPILQVKDSEKFCKRVFYMGGLRSDDLVQAALKPLTSATEKWWNEVKKKL